MKDIEELKDLLRHAKKNIDFYQELYSELDIDSIEDMKDFREKVPVIDKERLLEFYREGSFDLDSRNIEDPLIARPTSGTTSDMACYYRTKQEMDDHIERFKEATEHYFEGGSEKDRVLVATTFSLLPILSQQFLEKGCMVTSGSPFDIDRTVETFRTMECNTLVCSPPVALKISEKLDELDYRGLEKYYFVSSGLSSSTERRLRELFPDAEIMLQYGLAETGIVMKKCSNLKGGNSYHLFNDSPFHYEFITEEGKEAAPGEIGEIILTKFNEKTPLIRYSVGDLFEKRGKCDCGERIYRFVSRKQDKFKLKGVTVFKDRIEEALEPEIDKINHYQVLIDEEDGEMPKPFIRLKIEPKNSLETDGLEKIGESFSENFQVAEDYTWSKGVEMGLFSPVKVEEKQFEDRKFRRVKDLRYE